MKRLFKDLKIGDKFHDGKSKGMGINLNVIKWIEYQKIDKSHAKVINQIGYGNSRMINTIKTFSPYSIIFNLEDTIK